MALLQPATPPFKTAASCLPARAISASFALAASKALRLPEFANAHGGAVRA